MRVFQTTCNSAKSALFGVVIAGLWLGGSFVCGQQSPELEEVRALLNFTQLKLADAESQRKELMKSLAESVRVSEEQTFAARDVQEKMEAFGVDLFNSSKDSLEQRLLKAVRDLDILRQENERQRKAVHALSEAFLKYLAATPDAKENLRGEAEESIARAGKSLNELVDNDTLVKRLEKSNVVSFDSKIGLVVIDAGRRSGVLVGTPIIIEHEEEPIYTAIIVDVRDNISGALLQESVGDSSTVKQGDRVRPLATEKNL